MLFKNYDQLVANGQTPELKKKRKDVLDILTAALESVNAYHAVTRVFDNDHIVFEDKTIDLSCFEHVYPVGFGKASVGMAQAVCNSVTVSRGIVVTNDSSAKVTNESGEVVVGGHPMPNNGSVLGAEKILEVVNM